MPSERVQRRIDSLLDEIDACQSRGEWSVVREKAHEILDLDPENEDAPAFLRALDRREERLGAAAQRDDRASARPEATSQAITSQPTSFANGRYEVKRFLGEGGKKKVYLAHDASLDRDVAFALIKTEGLDEAARERITREAQAMGRLGTHPNIVPIFDIGEEPVVGAGEGRATQPYLVLPVMSGGDVEGLIERAPEHRLPVEQALKIATEVCLGLEFVHGKGIVHRDLKPGNIWLTGDEQTGRE